ncbi:MAG: DUF427 domain-containing protein [Actinomycetota bacterium]|nr:DUF427 domain-containing protein [Actinomycetota bacterium]
MPVRIEPSDKWVRAYVGGTAVVDSRAPVLFYEDRFPVPGYAFSRSDVRTDLLRPNEKGPAGGNFFFRPKGPVTQWFDLDVEGRVIPHAVWIRDEPELHDRLIVSWQPGLLDRWLEEDEEVAGHPRDPFTRVDALASSRHISVAIDGLVLADSRSPVLLFETGLPTRYYFPREDVNFDALNPSTNHSLCPYKGQADQYWDVTERPEARNVAWSYSAPFPAVAKIAGRVGFYNELVDTTVDGVLVDRPVSPFSQAANRPGSEPS